MVPRVEPQPRPQHTQRTLSANSTKHSLRSYTSSVEADDELSSLTDDSMGPEHRDGPATYAGEDTRLTSRKELWGWYAYGFAAEVFVICGMGRCICSHLSLPRSRKCPCFAGDCSIAWKEDWLSPCQDHITTVRTVTLSKYNTHVGATTRYVEISSFACCGFVYDVFRRCIPARTRGI